MFPSPLGDYVFNLPDVFTNRKIEWEFPSPLGDYVFNHINRGGSRYYFDQFPSPLGDYVFNHMDWLALSMEIESFRPLSGIMFSIKMHEFKEQEVKRFPSPLGDYVFNNLHTQTLHIFGIVSVPSRGLCFQSTLNVIQ